MSPSRSSTRRTLLVLLLAAAVGLTVFGIFAYRTVTIERASMPEALRRFSEVRSTLGGRPALLTLDESGSVVRRQDPPATTVRPIRRFRALVYRATDETLVVVDVPFWFFRMKSTAAQYAVRGTGLDLERLRITGADLQRYEPSIVIDHQRTNGDRLLVWTE